ncbi:MAG: prepilin-type N-terminal cleavage/methylation domain-containing protein [Methylococcales bacterium]|nr:prepilin-type N-terminal cleavage/methylation domain-containing protein [Methylococcales bacterium]
MNKPLFHCSPTQPIKANQGFTLVEMAIVLVVIGLILGAVSIGKDMQRNAEYTKIKQKFIDQWASAYGAYYMRAGVVLGDSQTAPRLMINGANYNTSVTPGSVISGQDMTSATAPGAICQGAIGPKMARSTNPVLTLHELMDKMGVRMPPGRAEGFEDRYLYLDTNGNPQELQICFQWNPPGTLSGSGNVMVITGLTPDLARMLDQMVDGKPDARNGHFRQESVASGTAGQPGVEWGANNRLVITGANQLDGAQTGNNQFADEAQVQTVVAHYKMNQ